MKPTVLQEVLVRAFESRQNILITGAPGIGKSDIVNQSVTQAGGDLILSYPVCSYFPGWSRLLLRLVI